MNKNIHFTNKSNNYTYFIKAKSYRSFLNLKNTDISIHISFSILLPIKYLKDKMYMNK